MVIKYLGAAYLLYLGIKILTAKRQGPTGVPTLVRSGPRKAFVDGIVVEALNVKTAMFFIAFIPQFVSPDHSFAPQFVLLGTICVLLNTSADLVAVFAASWFLAAPEARAARERVLSQVSGILMVCLGLFVALSGAH